MSSSSTSLPAPEGPGSVSEAPNLPEGFTDTFTSRYIDTGELRQHAVIGGDGPPLLLVHGWPENWYAWRLLMPTLASDFEVIAVDQRGIGLSDKLLGGTTAAPSLATWSR
jgi:pimeloyl-ACP methyl ester carboxylesterase